MSSLSASLTAHYKFPVTLTIRRMSVVKNEAQQAIEPEAIALAVLGGLAALAMLVLVGQGLAGRSSASASWRSRAPKSRSWDCSGMPACARSNRRPPAAIR